MTTYKELCQVFSLSEAEKRTQRNRIAGIINNFIDAIYSSLGIPPEQRRQPVHKGFPYVFEEIKNINGLFMRMPPIEELPLIYEQNKAVRLPFRVSVILVSDMEARKIITIPCLVTSKNKIDNLIVGDGDEFKSFIIDGKCPALLDAAEFLKHLVLHAIR